jgi:hypothetical protein
MPISRATSSMRSELGEILSQLRPARTMRWAWPPSMSVAAFFTLDPRVPPKNLLLIPSGHHAAIHVSDRSGDPARRVAQQEINDRTHVRRSAHATNRVKGVESRQRLADLFRLDESPVDRRFHHGDGNRVHADAVFGQFHG